MAGKPRRMGWATAAVLLASAAAMIGVRARADDGVTIRRPNLTIVNPFVAAAECPAKPPAKDRRPPSPARGQPLPSTPQALGNPFAQSTPPTVATESPAVAMKSPAVANPFSAGNAGSRRPLRWGPVSRWRAPHSQQAPPNSETEVEVENRPTDSGQPGTGPPANHLPGQIQRPIVLERKVRPTDRGSGPSSSTIRFEPAADNPTPAEPLEDAPVPSTPISAKPIPARLVTGDSVPPDPIRWSSSPIRQPVWLGTDDDSEAAPIGQAIEPAVVDLAEQFRQQSTDGNANPGSSFAVEERPSESGARGLQDNPTRSSSVAVKSPVTVDHLPPSTHSRFDPFDEPDSAPVIFTDDRPEPNFPERPSTAVDVEPIGAGIDSPADARLFLDRAEQLAQRAQSVDELWSVVQTCRLVLEAGCSVPTQHEARRLAAWALNRRGELKSELGDQASAIADFQAAIELDSRCWLAIHNRGVSYAQQRRYDAALRDLAAALAINPGLAIAYRNRAELLSTLGRPQDAIVDYSAAIVHQPDDAELYTLRGNAYHRLRDFERAMGDYDKSLRLEENNPAAHTGRGNVLAEVGLYERAIDEFQRALLADAEFGEAYRSIAWLLATCPEERFRDPQRALIAVRRAAELCSQGDPFLLETLAAAHASAGRFETAVLYQRQAVARSAAEKAAPQRHRLVLYEQQQSNLGGPNQ